MWEDQVGGGECDGHNARKAAVEWVTESDRSGFRSCQCDQTEAGRTLVGTASLLCKVGVMIVTPQGQAGLESPGYGPHKVDSQ